MPKDGKKKTSRPPMRPAAPSSQTTHSRVKHGHQKMYVLAAVLLVGVVLGALILSSSSQSSTLAKTSPKVGDTAQDFTFTTLDGSSSNLRTYLGHPVVLWWIATWCTSCQDGTQLFTQKYYGQYNASGVLLLQIESYNNLGQPGPDLHTFATSYGYANQKGWVMGTGSQDGTTIYNSPGYLDYYYVISSKRIILDEKPGLPQYFGTALQEAVG